MNWASIIKKSTTRDVFRGRDADVGSAFTIKNYPQKVDEWILMIWILYWNLRQRTMV